MPSICIALGSIPNTQKTKQNNTELVAGPHWFADNSGIPLLLSVASVACFSPSLDCVHCLACLQSSLALFRPPSTLLNGPERPISSWPLVSCPSLLCYPLKNLLEYSGKTQNTAPQSQEAGVLIPALSSHCAMLGKALGHSECWFPHL